MFLCKHAGKHANVCFLEGRVLWQWDSDWQRCEERCFPATRTAGQLHTARSLCHAECGKCVSMQVEGREESAGMNRYFKLTAMNEVDQTLSCQHSAGQGCTSCHCKARQRVYGQVDKQRSCTHIHTWHVGHHPNLKHFSGGISCRVFRAGMGELCLHTFGHRFVIASNEPRHLSVQMLSSNLPKAGTLQQVAAEAKSSHAGSSPVSLSHTLSPSPSQWSSPGQCTERGHMHQHLRVPCWESRNTHDKSLPMVSDGAHSNAAKPTPTSMFKKHLTSCLYHRCCTQVTSDFTRTAQRCHQACCEARSKHVETRETRTCRMAGGAESTLWSLAFFSSCDTEP